MFEGDKQLVEIWISFLHANHWMDKPDSKYVVTEKGRTWINKLKQDQDSHQ
jgi:hypothetical protein